MEYLKIGTRGSQLALAQAKSISSMLMSNFDDLKTELVIVRTSGDKDRVSRLDALPNYGAGVFVRELDQAVVDGRIDIAVHSMKDLPVQRPREIITAAVPPRASPWDVLVSSFDNISSIPPKGKIGTSSMRRKAELLRIRADLGIVPLRGNIDTRLKKLSSLEGIILGEAALERVRFEEAEKYKVSRFKLTEMIPSPAQGALAITTRFKEKGIIKRLSILEHSETRAAVTAERSFLKKIGGGCIAPIGALAVPSNNELKMTASVNSASGSRGLRLEMTGPITSPELLGENLASKFIELGANQIIEI